MAGKDQPAQGGPAGTAMQRAPAATLPGARESEVVVLSALDSLYLQQEEHELGRGKPAELKLREGELCIGEGQRDATQTDLLSADP